MCGPQHLLLGLAESTLILTIKILLPKVHFPTSRNHPSLAATALGAGDTTNKPSGLPPGSVGPSRKDRRDAGEEGRARDQGQADFFFFLVVSTSPSDSIPLFLHFPSLCSLLHCTCFHEKPFALERDLTEPVAWQLQPSQR